MANNNKPNEEQAAETMLEGSFLMRKCWREQISILDNKQRGTLLTAIYDYICSGIDFQTEDGMLKMLWATIKQTFDYDRKKYADRCEKNREAAKKRWNKDNANATECIQTHSSGSDIDI